MKALILAFAVMTAAADPAGLAGDYGNVTSSPFTGDIRGNELTIKFQDNTWSGTWRQAGQSEATAVQVIMPEEWEWIRVMVDGKKGHINYKYVSE